VTAGSRRGPICSSSSESIDDGTLCRHRARPPGAVGRNQDESANGVQYGTASQSALPRVFHEIQGNDAEMAWASQKGFYVHQRVTYLVIGQYLPKGENTILARAQVHADQPKFQTPQFAFRHAMRCPSQTVDEALVLANSFIRQQFKRAWAAPTRFEALFEFGVGLHTIQDSTSPAHTGFQVWSGEEGLAEQAQHVHQEMLDPGPGSALHRATATARQWFQQRRLPSGSLFIFGHDGSPQRV
jgi:hypothetical protein